MYINVLNLLVGVVVLEANNVLCVSPILDVVPPTLFPAELLALDVSALLLEDGDCSY